MSTRKSWKCLNSQNSIIIERKNQTPIIEDRTQYICIYKSLLEISLKSLSRRKKWSTYENIEFSHSEKLIQRNNLFGTRLVKTYHYLR